jgi:hypothetical protein
VDANLFSVLVRNRTDDALLVRQLVYGEGSLGVGHDAAHQVVGALANHFHGHEAQRFASLPVDYLSFYQSLCCCCRCSQQEQHE